jgi:indolepyruvate ferredoxin oxidoreductase
VARGLFHVMAYKDEYEVARLHTSKEFTRQLQATISGKPKITHHLAPPFLTRRDPKTGEIRKLAFGPWIRPFLTVIAKLKPLRGTPLDVFGYTRERRDERARIEEYERAVGDLCDSLTSEKMALATEIAALVLTIRGFGHVKQRNADKADKLLQSLMLKY